MSAIYIDDLKQIKDQYRAFGLPPGPSTPNRERAAGLELLRLRRKDAGPAVLRDERGEAWGCGVLAIPYLDYQVLSARTPELNAKDRETRNRAWRSLMRELGHVYGVDASIGRRKRNTGIIVK
jgi:hypothetical protein